MTGLSPIEKRAIGAQIIQLLNLLLAEEPKPPAETTPERMLTASEAAERLHVSPSLIYSLIRRGVMPAVQIGNAVRIPEKALNRWLQEKTHDVTG